MSLDYENFSSKRKREEEEFSHETPKNYMKSLLGNRPCLEAPLPLEWQRCLDIKSGQMYFYNMRTQKRTSMDPRLSPEPTSDRSLDLQLNLGCSSLENQQIGDDNDDDDDDTRRRKFGGPGVIGLARSPSWLTIDGEEEEEMVTAVCQKCHMLVMVCKASPICPNCKFVNPLGQSPLTPVKQRLSLLC